MMLPAPLWNWICLLFVPYALPNIWSPTRLYCDYPVMSSCTAVTPANLGRWMKSVASTRWTRCWAVSFAASCQVESFRRIPITLLTCLDEGTLNNSDVLLVDPNISKLASQQLPNWCVSSGSYASSQAPVQLPQSVIWLVIFGYMATCAFCEVLCIWWFLFICLLKIFCFLLPSAWRLHRPARLRWLLLCCAKSTRKLKTYGAEWQRILHPKPFENLKKRK